MKKSQKAYKKALKELDLAVKSARTAHQSEIDKLKKAEAALDALPRSGDAVLAAKRALLQAQLDTAKSAIRPAVEGIYLNFDSAVKQIRQELVRALNDAALMRGSDVDGGALALIQSHILRPQDLAKMVEDFSESPAMRGLILAEAERQLDQAELDAPSRGALVQVMEAAKSDTEEYLAGFDDLTEIARTISSRDKYGNFPTDTDIRSCGLTSWETLTSNFIPGEAELEDAE